MIGSLRGTATATLDSRTLIEVQGVGYWVFTGSWHPLGDTFCYVYHAVREDASDLYGFPNLESLRLFEQLISVSGIGPKAALAILSLGTVERIHTAILQEDTKFLSLAPGVGAKAAGKVVLDLKNKIDAAAVTLPGSSAQYDDLSLAAQSLGYKPNQIQPLLAQMPQDLTTTDQQLKWLLQHLAS